MKKKIPVISLFSGAMGLDLGLEAAGFEVRVAVECDQQAVATIKKNRPGLPILNRRIETVTSAEILSAAGLQTGGDFIVSGGPSCQSFSTAGQRLSLADPRGSLFHHFVRVVSETRPKFFVMENVRGMLSAAVKHRPLNARGPGHPHLKSSEELGSAFRVIVEKLKSLGYFVSFDLVNTADYGVPQIRHRLVFIGARDGKKVQFPQPTHSEKGEAGLRPWVTVRQTIGRLSASNSEGYALRPSEAKYLKHVPEGGNWRDLPKNMQAKALGGAFVSWGGRSGFYRRLAWDRPSPALPTQPNFRATMLCHPEFLRLLSVREYARLQQFPATWKFDGTMASKYRQIGNAVPVGLGIAIGSAIIRSWRLKKNRKLKGLVQTSNADLIRRMSERPITVLNPPRLLKKASKKAIEAWKATTRRRRTRSREYSAELRKQA